MNTMVINSQVQSKESMKVLIDNVQLVAQLVQSCQLVEPLDGEWRKQER